jgi:hypothetical protein
MRRPAIRWIEPGADGRSARSGLRHQADESYRPEVFQAKLALLGCRVRAGWDQWFGGLDFSREELSSPHPSHRIRSWLLRRG